MKRWFDPRCGKDFWPVNGINANTVSLGNWETIDLSRFGLESWLESERANHTSLLNWLNNVHHCLRTGKREASQQLFDRPWLWIHYCDLFVVIIIIIIIIIYIIYMDPFALT